MFASRLSLGKVTVFDGGVRVLSVILASMLLLLYVSCRIV